jgi:endonuclease/exonuclease/phosphatase family metal-dependent hydrolase
VAFKHIRLIIIIAAIVLTVALLPVVFLIWVSANEYEPPPLEQISVTKPVALLPALNMPIELYSWNIGYASLDASQDFIMDGGKGVRPATDRNVEENIWAIQAFLSTNAPDIVFFQEVDVNSTRSYGVNEAGYFSETWKGSSAFAYNFDSKFIPYPIPRFMGKVESGLLTLNSYGAVLAERISLPTPFKWPERAVQIKRCLLVERVPVQTGGDSTAQMVLVNLHLEAYDSGGEGREAQTRILLDFLKAEYAKGNYCVAGGDFNQSFPGGEEAFPLIDTETFIPGNLDPSLLGEGWIFAADTAAPTARLLNAPYDGNREGRQFYLIDGFIVSPNVEVLSVQTIDLDFKNSDHNPVKLTFSLK